MTASYANNPRGGATLEAMRAVLSHNWWLLVLRGVLGIVVGLIALIVPGATMLAIILVFAAYLLLDGIFAIVAAIRAARRHDRWILLVLEGLVNIAVAGIAVVWPGLTMIGLVLLTAVWAIITGGLMFAASYRLPRKTGRFWIALGGLSSILFGILLIVRPVAGALVLVWWFGVYAIVFGAILIVLGIKLKVDRSAGRPVVAGT